MENALQIFHHEEFGDVRTLGDWENPLFCLPDLCRVLELRVDGVVARLKDDPSGNGVISLHPVPDSLGRIQMMNFVNEDGLYDVILDSRKPIAKRFRKWITKEVIPSIRKTGAYVAPNAALDIIIKKALEGRELPPEQKKRFESLIPAVSLQLHAIIEQKLEYCAKHELTNADLEVIDLPGEIWRWVRNFEGLYEVSTEGRIRSFHRGRALILHPKINYNGYYQIGLYKDGKTYCHVLNQLIARAFIPNPENKREVDHRDGDRSNNKVINLRWATRKENAEYAVESGRYKRGEEHPNAVLTDELAREIYLRYTPHSKTDGIKAMAKEYNISRSTVEHVVYGQIWKHATAGLPSRAKHRSDE